MSAREAAIDVPASTSNLGAGFDCVGIAVDRWIRIRAYRCAPCPFHLQREGTLLPLTVLKLHPAVDCLVIGFREALRLGGGPEITTAGVRLVATSDIPIGRGLGSSAAALVAGARAANALFELGLDDLAIAALAGRVEGHGDNAAASALGGAVLVSPAGGGQAVRRLAVHPDLRLVFAVPDFALETRRARAVLPEFVPHRVAAGAAARSVALVQGLAAADAELLAIGLDDVLHVPFRKRLIPGYTEVARAARQAGAFGATLSGSGSSIVAVAPAARAAAVGAALAATWKREGIRAEVIQPSIVREFACR